MKSLWRHVRNLFVRQVRLEGTANASMMSAGALRAVRFPRQHLELFRLELFDRYVVGADDDDPLFHLSHRHYLSNSFTQRERIAAALSHHRFEDAHWDARYKEAVYHRGGLDLWSRRVDETTYVLRLRATTDLRHEGGLSVVLCADGVVLCEMSYAWVGAAVLGAGGHGIVPLITRNQSIPPDEPALHRFRQAFPQNSPTYFCLAAVHSIVRAHGFDRLAGIRHDRQVAFEERYAAGFRHSYCDVWQSFGAVEAGGVSHLMPVPLALAPIDTLRPKHRKRAVERRRHWSEIARETRDAIAPHLRPGRSAGKRPLDAGVSTSLMRAHAWVLFAAPLVA